MWERGENCKTTHRATAHAGGEDNSTVRFEVAQFGFAPAFKTCYSEQICSGDRGYRNYRERIRSINFGIPFRFFFPRTHVCVYRDFTRVSERLRVHLFGEKFSSIRMFNFPDILNKRLLRESSYKTTIVIIDITPRFLFLLSHTRSITRSCSREALIRDLPKKMELYCRRYTRQPRKRRGNDSLRSTHEYDATLRGDCCRGCDVSKEEERLSYVGIKAQTHARVSCFSCGERTGKRAECLYRR